MNKKIVLSLAVFVLTAAIIIPGCTKDKGKLFIPPPPPVGACDTITYNKHIKPLIETRCNMSNCHPLNAPFEDYTQVKDKATQIKSRTLDRLPGDDGYMPLSPRPALTPEETQLLRCWMENGMKEG